MPGPIFARGDRVALRTVEEEDLEFIQRWRNHPDVRVPLTDAAAKNASQVEEYFENRISDDDTMSFVVTVNNDDEFDVGAPKATTDADAGSGDDDAEDDGDGPELVGAVHIPWIREPHGNGMLMYWIAPPHQGNGYVTEATALLLDHAFGERRLHKVRAHVLESNAGSRRVLEKLGFEQEGYAREDCFVDGRYEGMYTYAILADEWLDRD